MAATRRTGVLYVHQHDNKGDRLGTIAAPTQIEAPEFLRGDLTAVSLFSGCGGLDLGVAASGFRIQASVEIDRHAVATLDAWTSRLPYPHETYHTDIRAIEPAKLMADLGLAPGELDLLVGGPPCQSFSGIGFRRGLDDPRGLLLFEMARFAEVLRPRAILVEQVKGLINFVGSKRESVLDALRDRLHEIGYETQWKLLNAADYGVPQMRQRVFIVAVQEGARFSYPEVTHAEKPSTGLWSGTSVRRTLGEVLADLGGPVRKGTQADDPNHVDVTPARDQERISYVPEGQWLSAQEHVSSDIRGTLSRKDTTKYRRLHRDQPALTLRCGEIHYHPIENRYLTPREYLRLHGYPDWFLLEGPIRSRTGQVKDLDQHRQVANSVPPPLARAVATSIREALERTDDGIDLGASRIRAH